jgi:hypothetical protein
MELINGKHYPLWTQFIQTKDRFVGGILRDLDLPGDTGKTEIVDITLKPNGDDSAFFSVVGEAFNCGFDCAVGGITAGEKGWITFCGYDGHTWRIKGKIP